MTEEQRRCAPVEPHENLYRVISPEWWVLEEKRISSVAFDWDYFSADVASLTTPDQTLNRFRVGSGLASFNCGEATELGFRALYEADPIHPNNDAHAHVYSDGRRTERKRRSQRLLASSNLKILREPSPPAG